VGVKKYLKGPKTIPAERIKKYKTKEKRLWCVFLKYSNVYIIPFINYFLTLSNESNDIQTEHEYQDY
jgi:hypothetical protein